MAEVILHGFQRKPATSVIAAEETTMNRPTVELVAALCTTAACAPAVPHYAQHKAGKMVRRHEVPHHRGQAA